MDIKLIPSGIPYKAKDYACIATDLINSKPPVLAELDEGSGCLVADTSKTFVFHDGVWYPE